MPNLLRELLELAESVAFETYGTSKAEAIAALFSSVDTLLLLFTRAD